jgi:hypothetical protein
VVGVDVSQARLRPDAVIWLGEWELLDTGEHVELACVVMRLPERAPDEPVVLDSVRAEMPPEAQEFARCVLELWRRERGIGS